MARLLLRDFVTTDSGTGIVHIARRSAKLTIDVLLNEQVTIRRRTKGQNLINAVAPDGKFTDEAPEYCRGRWVKDCDKDIIRDLKQRGLLFHQEQYLHDYPFCWRAEEDPLIQYPRESWFIRTTEFKDEMLANNAKINWLPEHIKDGPVRQVSGIERRLGAVARAVLGHAAADLEVREDGQDGSGRQLRRVAGEAGRYRRPRSGTRRRRRIRSCRMICAFISRTSTR